MCSRHISLAVSLLCILSSVKGGGGCTHPSRTQVVLSSPFLQPDVMGFMGPSQLIHHHALGACYVVKVVCHGKLVH